MNFYEIGSSIAISGFMGIAISLALFLSWLILENSIKKYSFSKKCEAGIALLSLLSLWTTVIGILLMMVGI